MEVAYFIKLIHRTSVQDSHIKNPLTSNDHYSGRTASLTSKRCILYIYSTNIGTEYFKHGIYSQCFSLQNAVFFHNSNVFGSRIIHILYTGCAKIKKNNNNSGAKRSRIASFASPSEVRAYAAVWRRQIITHYIPAASNSATSTQNFVSLRQFVQTFKLDTHTHTDRQHGDLVRILFPSKKESRLQK